MAKSVINEYFIEIDLRQNTGKFREEAREERRKTTVLQDRFAARKKNRNQEWLLVPVFYRSASLAALDSAKASGQQSGLSSFFFLRSGLATQ